PDVGSYFVAALARLAAPARYGPNTPEQRRRKKAVVRRLLRRIVEESRARNAPVVFVLFYEPWNVRKRRTWREVFLKRELDALGARYLDTKDVLLAEARARGIPVRSLYRTEDGHPTGDANALMARALTAMLASTPAGG